LRLKTHSFVPIVVIAAVTVGFTAVSANLSEYGASASEQQVGQPRQIVPPGTPSPVVDPTIFPVVDPTTPTVVGPITPAVVGSTTPAVVDPTTPAVVGRTSQAGVGRGTSPAVVRTTTPAGSIGPAPVNLGTAGTFAILTKSGITDVFSSRITGNVGASPITGAAIALTCSEVRSGTIYSVDVAGPLPCRVTNAPRLTTAVRDEESAYTDAAARANPDFVNLGAGQIGGLTLAPSLYKWTGPVLISSDVTLAGGPNDVWIFQIAGSITQASATRVRLTGGAQAKNVFWQAAGPVTIGTTAHSEGTILTATMIAMNTGASTNGRLLAQTQVTLQKNTVTNVQ